MVQTSPTNTLEILEKLISFDTTSYRSNLKLIEFISSYLSGYGIPNQLIFNGEKSKANLFASIGPATSRGIVLSGHTDVVPVDGQNWTSNPFQLRISEGRAYGRGTCDMKGFIASVLAAVPQMKEANLQRPIHLAFSYDEEIGCAGVGHLIEHITQSGIKIDACIIGEPSSLKPVTAHTGKCVYKCQFGGTAMHSSLAPEGVNAISYAADVIHEINAIAIAAKAHLVDDNRFKHPHPTINIGQIQGGKAVNIVAEYCEFDVECRFPPGCDAVFFEEALYALVQDEAHTSMVAQSRGAYAKCEKVASYPALQGDFNSPATRLVRKITRANTDIAVNYGTEAGLFQTQGYSSVVCGPGDIAQAHQPDEFIELIQLEKCDLFMAALVHELSVEEVLA
ncbi:acetylornithine deacetylase [Sneathiella sp. P13V-1]|uniref:acetylornithine deacetylase n=1 Tax=Sneathiella sp. P13V-1 TaxID=2697366 RepID=UPI00187BA718|nr:acetylornithine deacetylase [Sneathiella sp. P13V-1]MBE7637509.1 acetylornithine deacetylase [Sneathiella sp. P13V-1]